MNISEFVKKYDTQNQFQVMIDYHKQIELAWNNNFNVSTINSKEINKIIISGLGGSAISGDLLLNYLSSELKIPLNINRNYSLPAFADKNTLVIISSYSGNTEETISVFEEALKLNCNIIAVTSGGKISELAVKNKIPLVMIPSGYQPRYALGLSFFSLLKIFQSLKLIAAEDKNVNEIKSLWEANAKKYSQEGNEALSIAEKLIGYVPIIYSADNTTSAIGYRLKSQFNENSKIHAFHNIIPELNHNEIIGWETFKEKQLNAKLILIRDKTYHPQIKKRFAITSELVQKSGGEIISLESEQLNIKVRILDLIYLCDWITYYLAVLRGFDPSEIDFIHELKNKLQ